MSIKAELGKKIRKLREERGLSRGELCEGEEELTVRQLARIEAGESLPTLIKLEFIAGRLSVSVSLLIDKRYMELPKRYVQLKQRILRYATFSSQDRIKNKKAYFEEVYDKYYDELPEEEQVAIDIQQAVMVVHHGENPYFGKTLIEDYFYQIPKKEEYSMNDLLTIKLYMHCIYYENYDEQIFMQLFRRVIERIDDSIDIELYLIDSVLLAAASVFIEYDNLDQLIHLVNASNRIMELNQDFLKKPVIDMLEGKYYILVKKSLNKAKSKYMAASKLAELQGDIFLSEKIMEEWKDDLAVFNKINRKRNPPKGESK